MKHILTLFAFLIFFYNANAQSPSYLLPREYFSVDTGICNLNTPVTARFNIEVTNGYNGLRFKWKIDFGDGAVFQKSDTLTNVVNVVRAYEKYAQHSFLTSGNKNIKIVLYDSTGNAIDSIIKSYNVGGCSIATGLIYSDAIQNCSVDSGETIFGNTFYGFNNNGTLTYYKLDSIGRYNIPIFSGDTLTKYFPSFNPASFCTIPKITPSQLHVDIPVEYAESGYFDTAYFPDHMCINKPYFCYLDYIHRSGTGRYVARYDLGDGTSTSFEDIGSIGAIFSYVYTKPGIYKARLGIFLNTFSSGTDQGLIFAKERWVRVENCTPITLDLYYEGDDNCKKDKWEYPVDTARLDINSQIDGLKDYYSDYDGRIKLLVFPGDTLTLDTVAQYFDRFTGAITYVPRINSCTPSYITGLSDSVTQMAFRPGFVCGNVYTDANNNCLIDNNEAGIYGQTITVIAGNNAISATLTDSAGYYKLPLIPRQYYTLISPTPALNGLASSCSGNTATIMSMGDTLVRDFAYQCGTSSDAWVSMYHDAMVKGTIDTLYVKVENSSCLSGSGILTVYLDNNVSSYINAIPAPTSVSGNKLIYNIGDLKKINSFLPFKIVYNISGQVSQVACYSANIAPSFTDINPANNTTFLCDTVKATGYDNFKNLSVQDDTNGHISLLYTVGFKNNDTGTVSYLMMVDTLSNLLDTSSIALYESSHPVQWKLTNNVLKVTFNNVSLSSSSKDPLHSTAYIRFKVNPVMPVTAIIPNQANFYTDTFTVQKTNTCYYPTGFPVEISKINFNENALSVYPNPVIDRLFVKNETEGDLKATVVSLEGRTLSQVKIKPGINAVSLVSFSNGMYVLIVTSDDGRIIKRQLVNKTNDR